ncbi:RHS repeat-associated core domain-containing protein [Mesonia oceanica]|uniref:Uncharacterized protein n=1 Tax=Mesonia oceanica TaxID=2687242 RepID=A0AC61Y3J3_9FLAO|nr:RHS repeat-associated core domain-containing protein [Mesonia oceanica]MAQ40791.1 hypothetical protein [Mesonia sp.]MBJ98496.1 hypothetical protein [Flavobacteriaceae bacterium]VVU99041.1 hypothetical protein FVB9532_00291 [Mesonia oceanica]
MYDEFSRVVNQHQSTAEGEGIENYFIKADLPSPSYFSIIKYDELDRTIKLTNAEDNATFNIPGIEDNLFKTKTIIEQNNSSQVISEKFTDVRGRVVKEKTIGDNGDILTKFTYNAIGELLSYTDGDNITSSYEYDFAGRKIAYTNPDKGMTSYTYDRAGNLISLVTANLAQDSEEITYNYEYNRLIEENYPNMPNGSNISNVTYKYGSAGEGNQTGKLVYVTDATGSQSFKYGNMGEITSNTRIVVGPNIPTRYFTTNFNYDSWNRIKNIEYPDGENVVYSYDEGGNLFSIIGDYTYIKEAYYTFFESPRLIIHGNNTVTEYDYTNALRNVNGYSVKLQNGDKLLNLKYDYDKMNNVVSVANDVAMDPNKMGGKYEFRYAYDKINRLASSKGIFESEFQNSYSDINANYESELRYTNAHSILNKTQKHNKNGSIDNNNTYKNVYKYVDGTHKIEAIIDEATQTEKYFSYDLNGNLKYIMNPQEVETKMYWDESNRLRVLEENHVMHHYIYDYTGERVLKASSNLEQVYENGTLANQSSIQFNPYTTYPNPFIVIHPQGSYTKHYFNGSKRIATAIGNGDPSMFETSPTAATERSPQAAATQESNQLKPKELQQQQIADLQLYAQKAGKGSVTFKKYEASKDTATTNNTSRPAPIESNLQIAAAPQALPVYYYHANHLGSNTGITSIDGNPYQFFVNLPFGETLAEQYSDAPGPRLPYKFNGKELDQETGNYYYGARYYDPKWSVWLSVDPMAEKYPGWSPYNYTLQNPVNFTDPTGMVVEENPVYDSKGCYRGDTEEGFTGEPIIYDGDKDFSNMSKNELVDDNGGKYLSNEIFNYLFPGSRDRVETHIANYNLNDGLNNNGKITIKRHIVDALGGLYNAKDGTPDNLLIKRGVHKNGKSVADEWFKPTVENLRNLIKVHEAYGHITSGTFNDTKGHFKIFKMQIDNPQFKFTTDNFKGFHLNHLYNYGQNIGIDIRRNLRYRSLYSKYGKPFNEKLNN